MENELVRYSRAGDVFHYRWAARRCLRMIHPRSRLRQVIIEGSKERKMAGEYVIDVAEYYDGKEENLDEVAYFQLKHTTVQKNAPFTLSDLEDTLKGFAARFLECVTGENKLLEQARVTFSVVTNRPISKIFMENITAIGAGQTISNRFRQTLQKYTNLSDRYLQQFCSSLYLVDGEGDYNAQRHLLHMELSQLLAGTVESPLLDTIATLVQEKALPSSDGVIICEDIFRRLGATSGQELFPAPPVFEDIMDVIPRDQTDVLLSSILGLTTPVIVHAGGGVGKSVFARQMVTSLPIGSFGVVYDCFAGGRYRNRSEPRHRHRDALVQIANELASHGLCDPLIAQSTALEDEIQRRFLSRIEMAVESLRASNPNAVLVIVIDAADNAEMAADEYGQSCFAHELLRESVPDGCRLVALCRTERIHLLQPTSTIKCLELKPFSEKETLIHVRRFFSDATSEEAQEFHRLTSGNPRVQANALNGKHTFISQVLGSLGPSGTTIEEQIEMQLSSAVSEIKHKLSIDYQNQIHAICTGLATLPPFIPLGILAQVAEVDEATIKSFVADLGRPLWLLETAVQFRDEPTETWFRQRFSATQDEISSYVERLKPLANQHTYVAETLPSLLLQADQYDELINLAVSDDFLPQDNPIDMRNVRLYRLQFAFSAALRARRYDDAIQLALLAGEEVAGDRRQLAILTKNLDLIAPLLTEQKVQDLAFRRQLRGAWDGSENVYSAALLSSVANFRGEARGYLRSGMNWLKLYFEERRKSPPPYDDKIQDEDIVELTFAHFNLFGAVRTVEFVLSWRPPQVIFRITQKLISRLIDLGKFDAILEMSGLGSRNQYFMIALSHELLKIGEIPEANSMQRCLDLLTNSRVRIPKPDHSYNDMTLEALVSFAESCAVAQLPKRQILRALRHYTPIRASFSQGGNYRNSQRNIYLRSVALRCVLTGIPNPDLDELLPARNNAEKGRFYNRDEDIRELKEMFGGLLPWYLLRASILTGAVDDISQQLKNADERSKEATKSRWKDQDILRYEISKVIFDILPLYRNGDHNQIQSVYNDYFISNRQVWLDDRLAAVRAAYRTEHLRGIRRQLEQSAFEAINLISGDGPESKAEDYINLARAVLPGSREDAAAYFECAIEAVSKFGDEIVLRWEALVSLARTTAVGRHGSPHMAYRFIRCAELVGENVEREKYFDRDEAIRVCAKLSPSTALAALSRWRDRDVGQFSGQLSSLMIELVNLGYLSATVAWSTSSFLQGQELSNLVSVCLDGELSKSRRTIILETIIRDFRLSEVDSETWNKLKQTAMKHGIYNSCLDEVVDFYQSTSKKNKSTIESLALNYHRDTETINWNELFVGLDLTSDVGISQSLQRYKGMPIKFRNYDEFWGQCFIHVNEGNVNAFLAAIIYSDEVGIYDLRTVFSSLPDDWRAKISVRKNWGKYWHQIGRRFASELASRYVRSVLDPVAGNDMSSLHQGILEGLTNQNQLSDESAFFGFIEMASSFISPVQASDLLEFGLSRFELHMEDDYGDGRWSDWLMPPDDTRKAFVEVVWSALGAPRSKIRWQAAHCVRRLADLGCQYEMDELVELLRQDKVGAFGSNKFPFYFLHAQLYLLIALARICIDNPQMLHRHYSVFEHYTLGELSHILIQKISSEIALNIEKHFPGTYDKAIVTNLRQIGVSKLPIIETDNHFETRDSYWHAKREVDTNLKFLHGYDFGRYWFEPLGRIFGISGDQVAQLATEVIINQWHISADHRDYTDPRSKLWTSSMYQKETWNSHGSFPKTDDYSFYLSYHAMFVVAAKLLGRMPVVIRNEWYEDKWEHWLHEHLLTRQDGRWLADRRDPAPLEHREWFQSKADKEWCSTVKQEDFIDALLCERNGQTWINVQGAWEETDEYRNESIFVRSAFVSPKSAQSLLNALTTCENPHDFKLPDYQEEGMEFNAYPFVLTGWVHSPEEINGLDEHDPYAGKISFPPYQVGKLFVEAAQLSVDADVRKWFLPNTKIESLLAETWSTVEIGRDEEPQRHGNRLSASLEVVKKLCLLTGCELLLEVQIARRFKRNSYLRSDELGSTRTSCKLYILSPDGRLRDTETRYELRETVSQRTES